MKVLFFIISLFTATFSVAQVTDTGYHLLHTYKGDIAGAAMDNLNNLYLVSSTGQVKKLGPGGDSVGVFNGIRNYGKLYTIDVSNPLKPLLFYKDFATVVVLDRNLSVRSTINLRRYNMLQPSAIALSYDNNIWVYDAYDNKLRKLDEAGTVQLETPDFRQLFGKGIAPQKIINDNGLVYLSDTAAGIFTFDNYGAFKKKIDVKGWAGIAIHDGSIIRTAGSEMITYNPATFTEQSRRLPALFAPYVQSFITGNNVVSFGGSEARVYRVN